MKGGDRRDPHPVRKSLADAREFPRVEKVNHIRAGERPFQDLDFRLAVIGVLFAGDASDQRYPPFPDRIHISAGNPNPDHANRMPPFDQLFAKTVGGYRRSVGKGAVVVDHKNDNHIFFTPYAFVTYYFIPK